MMVPKLILLLVINDTFLMEQLQLALERYSIRIHIIGKCYSFQGGLTALTYLRPDLVIIDLDNLSSEDINQLARIDTSDCKLFGIASTLDVTSEIIMEKLSGFIFKSSIPFQ